MILALDPATICGWAAAPAGGTPEWGVRDFSGRGGNGEVIGKFRHWLNARCYALKPTLVIFESPYIPHPKQKFGPPMNALTVRRLMAFAGIIEATAWELRIDCREATTGEISKFFTGVFRHGGRDKKKAATLEMCQLHGWDVEDDNAADALALWAMGEGIVDPIASSRRGAGRLFLHQKESRRDGTPGGSRNQHDEASSLGQAKFI